MDETFVLYLRKIIFYSNEDQQTKSHATIWRNVDPHNIIVSERSQTKRVKYITVQKQKKLIYDVWNQDRGYPLDCENNDWVQNFLHSGLVGESW